MILDFKHFGGSYADSACIHNLLAYHRIDNPASKQPFSEPLCFGLAGGIGAGYLFCPSITRYGGSGISIPGRYKGFSCDAIWYQGCFERLGIKTRITETAAPGKAWRNLQEELEAGRPAVVWTGAIHLPFQGGPLDPSDCMSMQSFIVYGFDDTQAYVSGQCDKKLILSHEQLANARAQVCTHKNRTLTLEMPSSVSLAHLKQAIPQAMALTAQELLAGKIKTFSLPGLEHWAKMIANRTNQDGWLKVFQGKKLYLALRDVFLSIELQSREGGLQRGLYADFLDEASQILKCPEMNRLAETYRELGRQWSELADAVLPSRVALFKQAKNLLRKRQESFLTKGDEGNQTLIHALGKLRSLQKEMLEFPLDGPRTEALLETIRDKITFLHQAEVAAAKRLQITAHS